MDHIAVLVAGGTGTRMGSIVPKQLLEVAGKPILEHTIGAFDAHPDIDRVIVMMAPGHLDAVHEIVARGGYRKVSHVLEGAASRSQTTLRALTAITEEDRVLVHDAVRPFVSARIITDCVRALDSWDAVGTAISSTDTIVLVDEQDLVQEAPDRSRVRRMQTPQAFRAAVLRRAYDLATADPDFEATDDCSVVLRYLPHIGIGIVAGDPRNIKITDPLDLAWADLLITDREL